MPMWLQLCCGAFVLSIAVYSGVLIFMIPFIVVAMIAIIRDLLPKSD